MNLPHHLESYRKSVSRQLPSWAPSRALITSAVSGNTYFDHLKNALNRALTASSERDHDSYWAALVDHQATLLELLAEMSWEYRNGKKPSIQSIFGAEWSWFKFANFSLELDLNFEGSRGTVHLIPRYTGEFEHIWRKPGEPVFDADEIHEMVLLQDHNHMREVCARKAQNPAQKWWVVPKPCDGGVHTDFMFPIEHVNGPKVRDWVLPLN